MDPWGRPGQRASSPPPRRTAAADSPCSEPASTACCGPRRSSPDAPSGRRATCRRPTRPAGTAAAGPARRSRSCCSATRARPATASSGSRRRPARCSPAAPPSRADRRVYLRAFAKVGARSSDLDGQVDRALPIEPDVAVILIGANDVTHRVRPAASVGHLAEAVRRLRDAGVAVVVGTCPDLGTVKPIPPPLKQVARTWSRRMAAAQTIAVLEGGGRTVSLGSVLGPEFAAAPALLFGPDQFHPSAAGYRSLAAVLLPSMLGGARPDPRGRGRARGAPRRGRAADHHRGAAGRQHPRHRARRHRGRPAGPAASAASGSSCGTAAGTRRPRARPRTTTRRKQSTSHRRRRVQPRHDPDRARARAPRRHHVAVTRGGRAGVTVAAPRPRPRG